MAKRKRHRKEEYKVEIGLKKIIIMTMVVVIVLGVFYGLTLVITNKKPSVKTDSSDNSDVEIQYKEILAGRSFSMGGEYIVVYYDSSSDDDVTSLISSYSGDQTLYQVDLSSPLNSSIYSTDETSNHEATTASELKVINPTIIKFSDGSIVDYIESYDSVSEYLK